MANKKKNINKNRRDFVRELGVWGAVLGSIGGSHVLGKSGTGMKMGLVTYLWGKDWKLPELISSCEKSGMSAVELRTQHAHGVEPSLSSAERKEVKKRFADSPVTCVGYGSNQEYHSPDPAEVKKNIEGTYEFIKLCHDIGATGVKVKPNSLPKEVPWEKTIAQIGAALNKVGKYAADYGQNIRVEVHGRTTSELPVMDAIFKHVEEPNVGMCWNCNDVDLEPPGIKYNFNLVKNRLADTVHVRELDSEKYPYARLFKMLVGINYKGWILLEGRDIPSDPIAGLKRQVELFDKLVSQA